ncbi:MAG: ArgE/DapE family deacylase [Acidobacteriota bacterium]
MKRPQIARAIGSLRGELFELARELVRHPSVTGDEAAAQQFLSERWRGMGLEVDQWIPERQQLARHPAFCDDGLPVERPVVVARWGEGRREEPAALILNGHIDVVPAGDRSRWSVEPFEGRIDGGALYGRGSCDMKAGLAAATLAVRAAQLLGVRPRRPILLQSVTGEETGGLGTLSAILRGYRADAVVITEPTGLDLCPVHSGALDFRCRVPGRPTHGATREAGVSAIEKFWLVWEALRTLEQRRHERFRHPLFDRSHLAAPLSVGKLTAGNWPSTVPEEAIAEGRFGVFPGEELDEARRQFEEAIRAACEQDEWLRRHPARVEWVGGQFEPGETRADAPILAQLAEAHQSVTGRQVRARGMPYGCDLRLFTRYAGMPAVIYGPGDVRLAHAFDEHVPLEELLAATEVLTQLICRILGD